MKNPVIGITMDYEQVQTYSKFPWYALRENYCSSLVQFGAVALPLPHDNSAIDSYFNMIDGLVVTGGAFDIDPSYYSSSVKHETVTTKDKRTAFEMAITKKCLAENKPILGICGGEQLINVILGGTLVQHIPDEVEDCIAHEQENPRNEPGHEIQVYKDTLLSNIVGVAKMNVNTAHHQAVALPGKDVVINAVAEDEVIEGIEYKNHPFCLGVQWHPEFLIDPGDAKIMAAFVNASGKSILCRKE